MSESRASGGQVTEVDVFAVFPGSPGEPDIVLEVGGGILSDLIVRSAALAHPVPICFREKPMAALAFSELRRYVLFETSFSGRWVQKCRIEANRFRA